MTIRRSLLTSLLLPLSVAGCSNSWTAAIVRTPAPGSAPAPLTIRLKSTLGDEFSGVLEGNCLQVRIGQSTKLKNEITIQVLDSSGQLLGSAVTHDLANRQFELAVKHSTSLLVRPGQHCR